MNNERIPIILSRDKSRAIFDTGAPGIGMPNRLAERVSEKVRGAFKISLIGKPARGLVDAHAYDAKPTMSGNPCNDPPTLRFKFGGGVNDHYFDMSPEDFKESEIDIEIMALRTPLTKELEDAIRRPGGFCISSVQGFDFLDLNCGYNPEGSVLVIGYPFLTNWSTIFNANDESNNGYIGIARAKGAGVSAVTGSEPGRGICGRLSVPVFNTS